jgi:hypothetical protein
VDLAGNPTAQQRLEQGVFLQPADTTPNVGVKSGGREEEGEWNQPRPLGELYSGERGGWWPTLGETLGRRRPLGETLGRLAPGPWPA